MTRRVPLNDPNLRPVQITRLENPGGVVEGFEVGFTEYAPARRNRFVFYVWVFFTMVMFFPFLLLLEPVTTIIWLSVWANGGITEDGWMMAYWTLGGSALLPLGVWNLWPPFKSPIAVIMRPGNDWLEIWRDGRCVETAPLSQVRGVTIEPHPGLADAMVRVEGRPHDKGARWQANIYRQAESVFLMIGVGAAYSKIEVASIYASKLSRDILTMKIRAGLDLAWRSAMMTREEMQRLPSPPPPGPSPPPAGPPPKRRRRRGRIE